MFFCKAARVSVKVIEINESVNDGPFFWVIFNSASEFKYINCFRMQRKIKSDFWYRVRRGRCSITTALTKLDFNVHAVSDCICKQCHCRRLKLDHLAQNLKVFRYFLKRQLRCKREERATLFSVKRIAARNKQLKFNSFVAWFARRPKVEGGQSSWPKYIKIVHLVFWESFNERHNK